MHLPTDHPPGTDTVAGPHPSRSSSLLEHLRASLVLSGGEAQPHSATLKALGRIAADYPARAEELRALSVQYRREPLSAGAARSYVMALEALVAVALRAEVLTALKG